MKIKKISLLTILLVSQIVGAQSRLSDSRDRINAITIDERIITGKDSDVCLNYYSGKTEVSGKTATYVVEERNSLADGNRRSYLISNKCNILPQFPSMNFRRLRGDEIPFISTDVQVLESIIRSSIPTSKLNILSHYTGELWVIMRSDPKTGEVLEVVFKITTYATQKKDPRMVSPEELEKIEMEIKKRIKYNVPEQYLEHDFIKTNCYINFMNGISIRQSS